MNLPTLKLNSGNGTGITADTLNTSVEMEIDAKLFRPFIERLRNGANAAGGVLRANAVDDRGYHRQR